jgi:hypothetical protein
MKICAFKIVSFIFEDYVYFMITKYVQSVGTLGTYLTVFNC